MGIWNHDSAEGLFKVWVQLLDQVFDALHQDGLVGSTCRPPLGGAPPLFLLSATCHTFIPGSQHCTNPTDSHPLLALLHKSRALGWMWIKLNVFTRFFFIFYLILSLLLLLLSTVFKTPTPSAAPFEVYSFSFWILFVSYSESRV